MKTLRRNEAGFSAIELLITIIVIGMAFSAFTTTFVTLSQISAKSRHVALANTAAHSKLQEYENMTYDSLPGPPPPTPPGSPTTTQEVENFSNSLPTSLPPPRTGIVQIETISATLKRVTVIVEYDTASNKKTFKYDNYIQQKGLAR